MKRLLIFFALPILLFVLLSCNKDEDTEKTVDFTAQYTTFPVITNADDNGTLTIEIPSEGESNVMGASTWYSDCMVYNTGIEEPQWVQEGSSIFTAADGAQLIGTFEGMTGPVFDANGELLYPFAGDGTFVVTEGTGRYESYTGSGTYSYTAIEIEGVLTGELTFTGILNYIED